MFASGAARRDIGFHFVDQVAREAKSVAGLETMTANSYTVRSTINPQLQRAVETTLQEGLSRYERSAGRVQFVSAEAKLGKAVERFEAERKTGDRRPPWQQALANVRLPLYDVHWTSAIVVEKPGGGKKNEAWRVGLADGRIIPFSVDNAAASAQACALRCRPCSRDRRQRQSRRARRTARAPHSAGRCGGAGEQDRPNPGA